MLDIRSYWIKFDVKDKMTSTYHTYSNGFSQCV